MKKRIRILQFPGSLSIGGVGSMLMNIYRNIDKERYHFDFCVVREITHEGLFDREIEGNGSKIISLPGIRKIGVIKYIKQIKCILKENGPYDVVHVHSIFNGVFILIAAKLAGVKKRIYHVHSTCDLSLNTIPFSRIYKFITRYCINLLATNHIACGKEAAKYVYGEKYVNTNKALVINNALDLNVFHAYSIDRIIELRVMYRILEGTLVIGNAARFVRGKNQKLLIDIVFEISKYRSVVLLFAGDGETRKECEQHAMSLGIEDNVKFLGNVLDMTMFYNALDIFILPSLFEGLPVSCIEAQACGIPCLQADTITIESDMGLGLLFLFNLNNEIKSVVDICEQIENSRVLDNILLSSALKNKGYAIDETVNVISKIYND